MARDTLPLQGQTSQPAQSLPVASKRKRGCLSRLLTLFVILGVVGAGGYGATGPYRTLSRLRAALAQSDANALDQCVDFPTLRQNLKLQLLARTNTALNSTLPNGIMAQIAGGLAGTLVDTTVDTMVTPSGLNRLVTGASILTGQQPSASGATSADYLANAHGAFQSLSNYTVTVPSSAGDIAIELTRKGLDWRLTNVTIPAFAPH